MAVQKSVLENKMQKAGQRVNNRTKNGGKGQEYARNVKKGMAKQSCPETDFFKTVFY